MKTAANILRTHPARPDGWLYLLGGMSPASTNVAELPTSPIKEPVAAACCALPPATRGG